MQQELVKLLSSLYYIDLGASASIAALLISKYKNTTTKYFCYFLIYVFFMELIARFPYLIHKYGYLSWLKNTRFNNNYWYYTLFWGIVSGSFYSYYFQKNLRTPAFQFILKYGRYCFLLLSIILILTNFNKLFTLDFPYVHYLNTLIILLSTSLFLIEILNSEIVVKFYKNINFYIAASLLIWIIVTTPLVIFFEYYNELDMDYVYLTRSIMGVSNIFMYTCFAIGLIVSKPQLKND